MILCEVLGSCITSVVSLYFAQFLVHINSRTLWLLMYLSYTWKEITFLLDYRNFAVSCCLICKTELSMAIMSVKDCDPCNICKASNFTQCIFWNSANPDWGTWNSLINSIRLQVYLHYLKLNGAVVAEQEMLLMTLWGHITTITIGLSCCVNRVHVYW